MVKLADEAAAVVSLFLFQATDTCLHVVNFASRVQSGR